MASAAAGISYAPEDPALPKPWKGLVDDKTGYLYYWNPETNITQYEKPVAPGHINSAPALKSLSSSVQKSPQGRYNTNDIDDKYSKASNGSAKPFGAVTYQPSRSRSDYSQSDVEVKAPVGYVPNATNGVESTVSAEAYRRRHEISVTGDNVPQPFTSFEATGFSSEILREVRYLLPEEPNVVRCAFLQCGLACIWSTLIDGSIYVRGLSESSKLGWDFYWCNMLVFLLLLQFRRSHGLLP